MKSTRTALVLAFSSFVAVTSARADIPQIDPILVYDGDLEWDGVAVTGPIAARFALFDNRDGEGAPLWVESWVDVTDGVVLGDCDGRGAQQTSERLQVFGGAFSAELGLFCPLDGVFAVPGDYFLRIEVKQPEDPGFVVLDGLQRLGTAPFALWSDGGDVEDLVLEDTRPFSGRPGTNHTGLVITSGGFLLIGGGDVSDIEANATGDDDRLVLAGEGGVDVYADGQPLLRMSRDRIDLNPARSTRIGVDDNGAAITFADGTLSLNAAENGEVRVRDRNLDLLRVRTDGGGRINLGVRTDVNGDLEVNGNLTRGCQAGYTRVFGRLCISTLRAPLPMMSNTTAQNATAAGTCAAEGARVCTHADIAMACGGNAAALANGNTMWLGDLVDAPSAFAVTTAAACNRANNLVTGFGVSSATNAFRCCY